MKLRPLLIAAVAIASLGDGAAAQRGQDKQAPALIAAPLPAKPTALVEKVGTPMAVRFDAARDQYLVASAPSPGKKDGAIFAVSADSLRVKRMHSGKLASPRGMTIRNDELYVADGREIRVLALPSGKLVRSIGVPDAFALSDVTFGKDGALYAVDPGGDLDSGAVFRIVDGVPSLLVRGPQLWRPIAIGTDEAGTLVIGPSIGATFFALAADGSITGFTSLPAQRTQVSVMRPKVRIGGIVWLQGSEWIASSWEGGDVSRVILNEPPPLDSVARRHYNLMGNGSELVRADLNRPEIRKIADQMKIGPALNTEMVGRRRLPLWHKRAAQSDFLAGALNPARLDIDRKRGLLLVPEAGAGRLALIAIPPGASAPAPDLQPAPRTD